MRTKRTWIRRMLRTVAILAFLLFPVSGNAVDPSVNDQLLRAAKTGSLEQIKTLLAKGANVNAKDKNGETALMKASWRGRINIVKALLAEGANVNAKNEIGRTALMMDVMRDDVDIARLLLDKGADPNTKAADGTTALWLSVKRGHQRITKLLKQRGAILTLEVASALGDTERVRGFLEKGIDGQDIGTALIAASGRGHLEVVKLLLAKGADVNAQDKHGETALMQAAWEGNLKLVKALVDKGADINAEDSYECTALNYALHRNWEATPAAGIRVANFLRAHGAKAGRCRNPS